MFTPLKTLLVAGGLALGVAASALTPAQAANGSLTLGNGNLSMTFGNGPQLVHHRGFRPDYRRARFCTPRRALRKAERRGLRRAHIRRVNGRRIVVAGRMRGERVVIGMSRHRSCSVDFVRVRDGYRSRPVGRFDAPVVRDRKSDRVRAERPRRDKRKSAKRLREEREIQRQNRRRENR